MNLNYQATLDYVSMFARRRDLFVRFHDPRTIETPYTDGKCIHIRRPNALWEREQWDQWFYELYHELGHEAPVNCNPHWKEVLTKHNLTKPSILTKLMNLISDHIQEKNMLGQGKGIDRILMLGRSNFVVNVLLTDEVMKSEFNTIEGKIFKVTAIYDTYCREFWNSMLTGMAIASAEQLVGEEAEMFSKLLDSRIFIHNGENEDDSYTISKEILELFEYEVEEEDEKEKGEGDDDDGDEGGDDSGSEEGDQEGGLSEEAQQEIQGITQHNHRVVEYSTGEEFGFTDKSRGDITIEYGDDVPDWSEFNPSKDPKIVDLRSHNFEIK